jgi:hypothetical protein
MTCNPNELARRALGERCHGLARGTNEHALREVVTCKAEGDGGALTRSFAMVTSVVSGLTPEAPLRRRPGS